MNTVHDPVRLEQSQVAAMDDTFQALAEFRPCKPACIVALIAADPNVSPAFSRALTGADSIAVAPHHYADTIRPPQTFRATLGRHRTFLSQADADAYSAGWAWFWAGGEHDQPIRTPFSQGWFDGESVQLDKMDREFRV